MFLGWPCSIIWIRNNPETEIALSVIDLVDHFDESAVSPRHEFRPGRKGNGWNAVEQDANFPADVEKRSVKAIRSHFYRLVSTGRRDSHELFSRPHGFTGAGLCHLHDCPVDRR